ncbi:hypothetical protein TPHA_0L01040 [Tetrapisispora phaffii CBS 4417]|uniref:1-phosphatidylinositol-4-phosphate 5-kinase n=1 Tax=Tetrapisispora phaffii (strain ATCC 24235 / CBS 4417 / NBRC 1672 / NRRL Y-8282 / UCD 70-5) TaxID=1071381 RepID=G8BZY3_TETPH|nr:hypothetical protein TPHA_0L01040 [Tetrapisispora phaffii CBS 4417]CCE65461.1 hypothetical protein TPHA_0L01040 [Tetrapisispora phaffii CBS 4417]
MSIMISSDVMVPQTNIYEPLLENRLKNNNQDTVESTNNNYNKHSVNKTSNRGSDEYKKFTGLGHSGSYHSSSNSDSHLGSPRNDTASSTTSLEEYYDSSAVNNKFGVEENESVLTDSTFKKNKLGNALKQVSENEVLQNSDHNMNTILDTDSIIETESYLQDVNDDNVLLNKVVSRSSAISSETRKARNMKKHSNTITSTSITSKSQQNANNKQRVNDSVAIIPTIDRRRSTIGSSRRTLPFHSSKHAQILPMDDLSQSIDSNSIKNHNYQKNNASLHSLQVPLQQHNDSTRITNNNNSIDKNIPEEGDFTPIRKFVSTSQIYSNDGALKRSESAAVEIRKMREALLKKREVKTRNTRQIHAKTSDSLADDDRVLIGNRVSKGHVNFIIAYNMLTGIRVAVSRCSGIMKPLVPRDFSFKKKLAFDYHGNELTPSSQYAFKFKDYAPEVFRELRALFGLDPADYLVSLTSKYVLSELDSPGKSGSFFYYSRDYKYIIKTIHHAEHRHLRKHIEDYYNHVKNNPNTLVCQFYGLHRIKMPISFQNKLKHRRIYFVVMNNLFPPHLDMHLTYDLKGSTWGRFTAVDKEKLKTEPTYRPVLKDLNWLDNHESMSFGPSKKNEFLTQLKKDVELLSKLNTMDYSLLIGIHDMKKAKEMLRKEKELLDPEDSDFGNSAGDAESSPRKISVQQRGSMISHMFKQDEGGLRGSDENDENIDIIYYIGIIDCLTNYSIIKRLETYWRGINHDLKVVSAIPPKDYSDRFYKFISNSVRTSAIIPYKDDPTAKPYKDKI